MRTVFADTSFYVAISSPRDVLHQRALDVAGPFRGHIVTTEFVLIELGNWLSRTRDRQVFIQLVELVRSDPAATILPATTDLFRQGYELFS
ncbi:MAG: type II toxin-antitoxin system VapC family toxin, partial [Planctomycetaceae bacterium]